MARRNRGRRGRETEPAGAGKSRRARTQRLQSRIKWFGTNAFQEMNLTIAQRVALAGQLLRDKVVANLSKPVRKFTNRSGKMAVDPNSRSKPGEYPRADTTRLMKSITYSQKGTEARIGTNVKYGLLHEVGERPFLSRTLKALRPTIVKILTQRIRSKKK